MRLVDTSAWIEWLAATPAGEAVAKRLPSRDKWLVPTIVQLELYKWLLREAGEDRADQVLAFSELCTVVPLDTKTAVLAVEMCGKHRLATADAIIYATATLHDADLLTCDAHFDGLPRAAVIAKLD
jgi:predicted nucleic acid-binding protein